MSNSNFLTEEEAVEQLKEALAPTTKKAGDNLPQLQAIRDKVNARPAQAGPEDLPPVPPAGVLATGLNCYSKNI